MPSGDRAPGRATRTGKHPAEVQLHIHEATIERGGTTLLDSVSLTVAGGDRIGLVGPNGAGKSSLLAVLAGQLEPVSGSISVVPDEAPVGLLAQELDAVPNETITEYLARRTGVAAASRQLDAATEALSRSGSGPGSGSAAPDHDGAGALDRYHHALERWMRLGGHDLEGRLGAVLESVGLGALVGPDGLQDRQGVTLSGGQQARLGLAALLLARHDILLLDEPTNDLDQGGLEILESFALDRAGPLVVVSHDRRFVERVATSIVEIDPHRRSLARFNQSFQGYLEAKELARAEARRRFEVYDRDRQQLIDRARRQRQWAAKGVRAERNPPDNDRAARGARIEQAEQAGSKARQSERALERLTKADKPWEPWALQFTIGETERSGDLVAELVDAELALGSFSFGPVTVMVGAGDRVAIVGENGQGKTTLVKALFGQLPLDRGHQRQGRSTVIGWLDQARDRLVSDESALHLMTTATGIAPEECRSVLAKFGLGADHLGRPAAQLSPGERTRAVLAQFQASGVNTLVLDEPTNHLDLVAIEQLETALDRFAGTMVLITHDRSFLDATSVERTIVVDGGKIIDDRAS